jgi:hypothetical protein
MAIPQKMTMSLKSRLAKVDLKGSFVLSKGKACETLRTMPSRHHNGKDLPDDSSISQAQLPGGRRHLVSALAVLDGPGQGRASG